MTIYEFNNCDYRYDESVDAIYISFVEDGNYYNTVDIGGRECMILIDVDEQSRPLGLEVLDWSKNINTEWGEDKNEFKIHKIQLIPLIGDVDIKIETSKGVKKI